MGAQKEIRHRADLSDHLAAERTFLAWIRTGLALTGFGFVLARFSLILQEFQYTRHITSTRPYELSPWFGTALIAVGVAVYIISAWHHIRLVRRLDRGGPLPSRPSTEAVAIALFLALVGLVMVIYLVSVWNYRYPDSGNGGEPSMTPAAGKVIVTKAGSHSADPTLEKPEAMLRAGDGGAESGIFRNADFPPRASKGETSCQKCGQCRSLVPAVPLNSLNWRSKSRALDKCV